jgi:hypothetical protein
MSNIGRGSRIGGVIRARLGYRPAGMPSMLQSPPDLSHQGLGCASRNLMNQCCEMLPTLTHNHRRRAAQLQVQQTHLILAAARSVHITEMQRRALHSRRLMPQGQTQRVPRQSLQRLLLNGTQLHA